MMFDSFYIAVANARFRLRRVNGKAPEDVTPDYVATLVHARELIDQTLIEIARQDALAAVRGGTEL